LPDGNHMNRYGHKKLAELIEQLLSNEDDD